MVGEVVYKEDGGWVRERVYILENAGGESSLGMNGEMNTTPGESVQGIGVSDQSGQCLQ